MVATSTPSLALRSARDVLQGGVVVQATLEAPSLPGYGVARHGRRCLGAGFARSRSVPSDHLPGDPGGSRQASGGENFPPGCEGQRTWVLATVVPTRKPAKTLELQSFSA